MHDDVLDETDDDDVPDDRLRLIFTCCHPALGLETRVALALRTLCGLAVDEVARAFGVSEAAMAKRLVRARSKILHAGIPYRVPPANLLPGRLSGVLAVLFLSRLLPLIVLLGPAPIYRRCRTARRRVEPGSERRGAEGGADSPGGAHRQRSPDQEA